MDNQNYNEFEKEIIETTATEYSWQSPNAEQNSANSNQSFYQSSYLSPQNSSPQPEKNKKSGKSFLKAAAFIMAFVLVASGSIVSYKFVSENDLFGKNNAASYSDDNPYSSGTDDNAGDSISGKQTSTLKTNGLILKTADARANPLSTPEIYEKVIPSVVGIRSTFSNGIGTGTGIIMTSDGYIITNAHVVVNEFVKSYGYFGQIQTDKEEANKITVILSDDTETELSAVCIGADTSTDIAVLKINATGLTPAEFGNSNDLLVGEDVIAIGNPLGFELFGSLTKGVISALNRDISINETQMSLIQTDTAINAGNSGGPLINVYGQVIGINSAKMSSNYSSQSASIEGLAFAIPITGAKKIVDDLMNYGYVTGKPKLGVTCRTISAYDYSDMEGAMIVAIEAGGAANIAGLSVGDIILGINGVKISTKDDLVNEIGKYSAGDTVTIHFYRERSERDVNVTLAQAQASTNF